jgi:hypothetical protein
MGGFRQKFFTEVTLFVGEVGAESRFKTREPLQEPALGCETEVRVGTPGSPHAIGSFDFEFIAEVDLALPSGQGLDPGNVCLRRPAHAARAVASLTVAAYPRLGDEEAACGEPSSLGHGTTEGNCCSLRRCLVAGSSGGGADPAGVRLGESCGVLLPSIPVCLEGALAVA